MHAAKRFQIAAGLLGKRPKGAGGGVGYFVYAFSLERMSDGPGARHRPNHVAAEAGEDGAAYPLGVLKAEKGTDARTHRVAHYVGALDGKVVQQAARVLGHDRRGVSLHIVELFALAVAAVIDADDPEPVAGEQADPTGIGPIVLHTRGKAMHQQHRLAPGPRR